jgi:hypothetical protein
MRNAIAALLNVRRPQDLGSPSTVPTSGPQVAAPPTTVVTASVYVPVSTVIDSGGNAISTNYGPVNVPFTFTPSTVTEKATSTSIQNSAGPPSLVTTTVSGVYRSETVTANITYTAPTTVVILSISSSQSGASTVASSGSGTTTSTSGPSPSQTGNNVPVSKHGLASGVVAGIAVGCAAAGAIIAFIVFVLLRNKRGSRVHSAAFVSRTPSERFSSPHLGDSGTPLRQYPSEREKGGAITRSTEEATAENVLSQPKDDGAIKQSVATLFKAIDDHTENYYTDTPFSKGTSASNEITEKLPAGITVQNNVDFDRMLVDHLTRSSAITALITAQVLDCVDFFGDPQKTLLPKVITGFLRSSVGQVKDTHRGFNLFLYSAPLTAIQEAGYYSHASGPALRACLDPASLHKSGHSFMQLWSLWLLI